MIRKFLKRIANWTIKQLSTFSVWLGQKAVPNPYSLDDLSPVDDITNGEPYFKSLEWALQNRDIKNIAITGPYGSGKSSVIRSFEKTHPEYNFLNISLASFRDGVNIDKPINDKPEITADENRLVEISILQQIFYKVKARSIPDSRFKRIKSLSTLSIIVNTSLIVAVCISLIVLLKPIFFNKFSGWEQLYINNKDSITYGSAAFILFGLIVLGVYMIRLFSSKQFEKLNISSGEIAIKADNEKSILNKHLDEIIYFFEVTNYDVVIIEDLDRFKNHDIFTKLREINILLNNSRQINRKIVFIYALKDDMFLDKTRTKFFEFILPVIPVVNWSNSFSILMKKLSDSSLKLDIDEKFIRDITLYIDDMRILKNIFNEFIVYRENLRSLSINQNKLLGIIVYKNFYPSDFALLHETKGIVSRVFKKLGACKQGELEKVNKKVIEVQTQIEKADTEMLKNINELKAIYIQAIYELTPTVKSVRVQGTRRTAVELKQDEFFNMLKIENPIYVYMDPGGSNTGKTFADIEKIVDPNDSYTERANAIENKKTHSLNSLRSTYAKLTLEKNQIISYSLKEFLDAHPEAINTFDKDFLDKNLLVYLLREGYIDEMYNSLTSYFYEGSLTKNDMDYLLSIKNMVPLDFVLQLTKLDEVIKGITRLELKREAALNFSFMDYLLANPLNYKEELELLFSQFSNKGARHMEFIFGYLDKGRQKGPFIVKLCEYWKGFCETVLPDSKITAGQKDQILRLIIINSNVIRIGELDKNSILSNYVSDKEDFLLLVPEKENLHRVIKALDNLNVKFKGLVAIDEQAELVDHIYKNDYYAINTVMIARIINTKGKKTIAANEFELSNYSAVQNSGCDELVTYIENNIDEYISKVFLTLDFNTQEPEDVLVKLLNNDGISFEKKKHLIEKEDARIINISQISLELWDKLVEERKMIPKWRNVLLYFTKVGMINEHLANYLNHAENYMGLTAHHIEPDEENDDKTTAEQMAENLSRELVVNSKITDQAFEKLVNSITSEFDGDLNFDKISDAKIVALITNERLAMSVADFEGLKKRPSMKIFLIKHNIATFIQHISEYALEPSDLVEILGDEEIAISNRLDIISKIPEEIITGQQKLANLICVIIANNPVEISLQKIKKILAYSTDAKHKVVLLINKLADRTFGEIDELLTQMGEPYDQIPERGKRPTIFLNQENVELVRKLVEVNYISSFKIDNEDERIRVNTKQPEQESEG